MKSILIKVTAVVTAFAPMLTAVPVHAASVYIDTNERNFAPSVSSWNENGDVEVSSNGLVEIDDRGSENSSLWKDISVSSSYEGDYALLISFTRPEDLYSSTSVAGVPYLYGYFMDGDEIIEYLQADTMRNEAGRWEKWGVSYGIFRIEDDTDKIRFFLMQGAKDGTTNDGRSAYFYKPALYIVDSEDDARDVIEAYIDEEGDVASTLSGSSSSSSGSSSSNNYTYPSTNTSSQYPPYAVDTLLKCPNSPAVYSMTIDSSLRLFPNEDTFYAWGKSFANVVTIDCGRLAQFPIAGSWTYTRADYLIKFTNSSAVYTLDNGKYLRHIPNERTAQALMGWNWASKIVSLSPTESYRYVVSAPHASR